MADALVGATAQVLLEKILALATDDIGLIFGFKKDVEALRSSVAMIQAVLADAEEKQLKESAVKLWLKNLEGVAYEADNVFDELNYEMLRRKVQIQNLQLKEGIKVCFFFSFSTTIAFRWKMASKVRDSNIKLKFINEQANSFGLQSQLGASTNTITSSTGAIVSRETDSVVDQKVVGRENDASKIVEKLLSPSAEVVSFIPITGMGGLGKTTLAQLVYNDKQIEKHFDKRIWICVSDNFEVTRLFKLILESLVGNRVEVTSRDVIVQKIKKELEGKRYFLVLDDVWNENAELWSDFLRSLVGISTCQGNWSMVTTRKLQVASNLAVCYPYSLEKLSDDNCWSIVKERAFFDNEVRIEMASITEKITRLCQGLPLVASVIGGFFRINSKEEWLSIVDKGILNMSEGEKSVLQILKLSFDHLPSSSIKKCFAYCSLFSKGSDIEKEKLIQLWMAEGFLQPNLDNGKMMEEIGNSYFNILLQSSLLQEVRNGEDGTISRARMHDLVHDLGKLVSKSEMVNLNDEVRDDHCHTRYLVGCSLDNKTRSVLKETSKSLRALFIENGVFDGKLSTFKYLRVLNLSGVENEELPTSISKLIHLRYLDLSYSAIRALPGSLCELYNLQTLRFTHCTSLKELPKGLSNLISLRHLYCDNYGKTLHMPVEMRKLTCLQTLKFFNVSQEKGCQIEELGCLKNLRGELRIHNLELVNGKEGAQQANLSGKPHLSTLELEWAEDRQGENNDEDVLEGLRPHPHLQELKIENFMGHQFPSWLMNMALQNEQRVRQSIAVTKLVRLTLESCKRCKQIPALGDLPSLKYLEFKGLENITSIESSFYGIGSDHSNNGSAQDLKKIFPALKNLKLIGMQNLIEWKEAETTLRMKGEGLTNIFPELEYLTIEECPQLSTAPSHFPSLKYLVIQGVEQFLPETNICSKVTTLVNLEIRHTGGFECVPDELFSNNRNLSSVKLEQCPDLKQMRGCSISLQQLNISECDNLRELPEVLHKFVSLKELIICKCPNLKSAPISGGPQRLTSLPVLVISNCPGLTSLPGELVEWSKISLLKERWISVNG